MASTQFKVSCQCGSVDVGCAFGPLDFQKVLDIYRCNQCDRKIAEVDRRNGRLSIWLCEGTVLEVM